MFREQECRLLQKERMVTNGAIRMSCDNKKGHGYPSTAGGEHCAYMCYAGMERVIDSAFYCY